MNTMEGTEVVKNQVESGSSVSSSLNPLVATAPGRDDTPAPLGSQEKAMKASRRHFWQIPLLVILGTACAGGGAWLLASGQFLLGFALWIAMLGCAYGANRCEPSGQLDFGLPSSSSRTKGQLTRQGHPASVSPEEVAAKVSWRCQIAVNADTFPPADLLVVTTDGIDLISTAPEAWEALGNRSLSTAMTSKIVSDAIDGSRSWRDLADIELCRFDAFVSEHGYAAVAKASAPKVSYGQESIAFAGVYRRRFVASSYFEIELFDGTTDKRDLIADDERLDALRNQLSYLGYQQRFRESGKVA